MSKVILEISEELLIDEEHEPEWKLAHLLIENVIFINNGWWIDHWPKDSVTLHVNCNDIFSWASADGEDITHSEINELYKMWKKDPGWGPAVWCIKKRKLMPQKPVEDMIRKAGIWNLDEILGKK